MSVFEKVANLLTSSQNVVALTGAGVSVPSGIPDFRSEEGFWNNVDPMEVASLSSFVNDPTKFYHWQSPIVLEMLEASPNIGHQKIAFLERQDFLKGIITQNIDLLHEEAGSENVLHMHGSIRNASCLLCGFQIKSDREFWINAAQGIFPFCDVCKAPYKPDITLFGEPLPEGVFPRAVSLVEKCDVLLVLGTSLNVYPVAGFPKMAKENGVSVIILNKGPTSFDNEALKIEGCFVKSLLAITDVLKLGT